MRDVSVAIPPPARSAYDAADSEKLRLLLDEMLAALRAAANWRVRKKTLLDLLAGLEAATIALHRSDEASGDGEGHGQEDPEAFFIQTVPMFLAAVLERLGEARLSTIEQAAFYMLSAHPEHQGAAQDWIDADPRHFKEFKKFLAVNRFYRRLLERGSELAGSPS